MAAEHSTREPYSLVLITLNAGAQLARCLASVPDAAEIVIVDSGSRDDTAEIAARFGARLLHRPFDGFGRQKQFAVEQAKCDWVLCLDADEELGAELRAAMEASLVKAKAVAFRMARRNRFMGRWLQHGEGYPDWSLRLFDRRHARWSEDAVHEKVICDGAIATLRGDLLHNSAESLADYLSKQNRYTSLQAQALHQRGKSASVARLVLSPCLRFVKFYVFRLGLLDGIPGLVHIAIGCFASFLKYAKLRALTSERNTV